MSQRPTPLTGVKVLTVAEQYPGPLCAQLLADLGADVIQLERPGAGDPARVANPWLFRATNTNRRSIALNLKDQRGLAVARQLIKQSHIFLEGYRPGTIARLGLDYESVRAFHPSVVYCSISGFGQDGPYADVIGHNINYESVAGMLDTYVDGTDPEFYFASPTPFGDVMSGALAALGVVAALRQAERDGAGAYLDISITEALLVALIPDITRGMNSDHGWHRYEAGYGLFRTKDAYLALGIAHEEPFWAALCRIADLAELAGYDHDERLRRRTEIKAALQSRLAQRTTAEWLELFGTEVPGTPVYRLREAAGDPHLSARGLFATATDEQGRPFRTVLTPFSRQALGDPGPLRVESVGESTLSVLREEGVSEDDIAALGLT